jgi:hypothetical protein
MRQCSLPICAALLLCGTGIAVAQEKPQEIIKRAITAHGGQEKLAGITCDKVKVHGTVLESEKETPFTAETYVNPPAQLKSTITLFANDRKMVLVQILNGDKTTVTLDGQPQKVTAAAEGDMRETLHLQRCVRLAPLLTEKGLELTALEETKVNDQLVYVVKVAMKGHKDLRMYFDKETSLLVKTEHPHEDGGKEVKQEEFYSANKDLGGGFKRATRITVFRDGKKVEDAEVSEVKYLEKIPDAELANPK